MKRALAFVLALASVGLAIAQPRAMPVLPIVVTVAHHDAEPVVAREWIDAQVQVANTLYAGAGVRFRIAQARRMGAAHAALESREDRHALGRLLRPRVINCFVVASLRDVDEPSRFRQGVHWRPRLAGVPAGAHLVIVSSIAGPTVLAHELGHFFGNPHSTTPGNLMSYERGDGEPVLDGVQTRRTRARARAFLESGEIVAATRRAR